MNSELCIEQARSDFRMCADGRKLDKAICLINSLEWSVECLEKRVEELEEQVDKLRCYSEAQLAENAEKNGAIGKLQSELALIRGEYEGKLETVREEMSREIAELKAKLYEYMIFQPAGVMCANKTDKDVSYILACLKKRRFAELTRYEIFRMCRGRFKSDSEMSEAFSRLEEYGYITKLQTEYKGVGRRPSQKYTINPYIYGLNGLNGKNRVIYKYNLVAV